MGEREKETKAEKETERFAWGGGGGGREPIAVRESGRSSVERKYFG